MIDPEFTLTDDFPPVDYQQWRALVEQDLKGAPFEKKLVTQTYDGIAVQPLYTQRDRPPQDRPAPARAVGARPDGWSIRQLHAQADLDALRHAIADDFRHGVRSVEIRLDAAARAGIDPDDELAASLVGKNGAALYTLADLRRLLDDPALHERDVEIDAGAASPAVYSLLATLLGTQTEVSSPAKLTCCIDPLGVLARDGELPAPIDVTVDHAAELVRNASAADLPCPCLTVDSSPYHDAGATATQDLACALATAVVYLRALERAGLSIDEAARGISFRLGIGCNLFRAIAKLRAIRSLWARVIQASGGSSASVPIHVRTGDRVITARDPWVNLLRNTICCFAAAAAGAESITTIPFDDRIGPSDAFSRRVARNTQLLLLEESHLARVLDPAAGSWFIESLTDEIIAKAWSSFQDIERRGGMIEALTSGWIAEQIDTVHQARLKNLSTRKDPITGVSEFPDVHEEPVVCPEPDAATLLTEVKQRFAQREISPELPAMLERIITSTSESRLDAMIAAASAGASIAQLMRAVTHDMAPTRIDPLPARPLAQPYEDLRDASDRNLAAAGNRPRVFLANMGPIAHHTARATYTKNFFEVGGFEVLTNNGFDSAHAAAAAFRDSGANIAVICSSDRLYETFVTDVAPALKNAGARTVILAGHPGEHEQQYRNAGVDRFIYIRCNVLQTLQDLLREEGVLS